MTKTIVVLGATGQQGGSVVKAILADPQLSKEWKVRGVTRDTSKPAAQALAKQGVELASADLHKKETLASVFKGADAVFFVTNYWEYQSQSIEVTQGKNVADAAHAAGVKQIIFSSLENVTKISHGKLKHVVHFDGKNDIEQYIRGLGFDVATFVYPGFYMSNFSGMQMLRKGEDGMYALAIPVGEKAQYPLFDTEADFGRFTLPALKLPKEKANGLKILAAAAYYTPVQMVEQFKKVTGKEARFVSLPAEQWKSFLPKEMAEEMLENMLLLEEPGYYNGADLQPSIDLIEGKPTTWEEFVKKQKAWME